MSKNYDENDGVWRTIGGRRVFIRNGQSLSDAMKESGKFSRVVKNQELYKKLDEEKEPKLTEKQKEAGERLNKKAENGVRNDIKDYLSGKEDYDGSREEFINDLSNEWGVEKDIVEDILHEENTKHPRLFKTDRQTTQSNREQEIKAKQEAVNKSFEENQRLEIAKDIAKEVYGLNENSATPERIEREARKILEYGDGEVLEKGDTPYTNSNGQLERSTKSLKEWRDNLKDGKKETSKNSEEVVKLPDGTPIDQNYIKDIYSGMSYDEVKRENDFDKEWMNKVNPEARPMQTAKVRETEKYLANMERYESRIDDKEFGKKEWGDGVYPFSEGTAWKGTKSGQNLSTTEIAKEVTNKMKEAYPGVTISRKTSYYSGGSSADFSITSSDKPLIRSIDDFSETELNRLYNKEYNSNHYKDVGEFKEALSKRLSSGNIDINKYHIDEDYELTPYGKAVVKDLKKVIDAYNYDESDGMTDYFNTGFYSDISIGKYNKPYEVNTKATNMNDTLRNSAYKKYMKEHPNSKMTLDEFLKKKK